MNAQDEFQPRGASKEQRPNTAKWIQQMEDDEELARQVTLEEVNPLSMLTYLGRENSKEAATRL
jgi:hypothetical protein